MEKQTCHFCKYYTRGRCSKWPNNEQARLNPRTTSCSSFEPALFRPGMKYTLVERLVGLTVCVLFTVICFAQSILAAEPHHRVLFGLGAVLFALITGHTLARNSE